MKMFDNQPLSLYTIKRLSIYLRDLKRLKESGMKVVSSSSITESVDVSPAQFRKDLSYFGGFGTRGVGYDIDTLITAIEHILGTQRVWQIALVGVGRLGSALLSFPGFESFNLKIAAVFDKDKRKIGHLYNGLRVHDIQDIRTVLKHKNIKIGMLTTPPESAQEAVTLVIEAGIRAILNFTPVNLKPTPGVFISNVDMACKLQTLVYFLTQSKSS